MFGSGVRVVGGGGGVFSRCLDRGLGVYGVSVGLGVYGVSKEDWMYMVAL